MARVKPTERKLVASLLMQEADDADELAERIITALDEKRGKDNETWVLTMYEPNVKVLAAFGPYGTQNAATKDITRLAAAGPLPAQAWALKCREIRDAG